MKKIKWNIIVIACLSLVFAHAETVTAKPKPKIAVAKKKKTPDPSSFFYRRDIFLDQISVKKALKKFKPKKDIVIAFIDTGIDPKHSELKRNKWIRPGTVDEYGWDFVRNSKNPLDTNGHGSHVAGIAISVAPKVKIMAIRYFSNKSDGNAHLSNTIKAINYAIKNKADIINYSGGGAEPSSQELQAIERARAKGILFVAAAGNNGHKLSQKENKYYPASYKLSNIISVGANDIKNSLIPWSNWGKSMVDVAAPGDNILSTLPVKKLKNGKTISYGYLTGTSQSTAFVSGLAALIWSHNPSLTYVQIKNIILKSVDKQALLKGKVKSEGRINVYSALKMASRVVKKKTRFTKNSSFKLLKNPRQTSRKTADNKNIAHKK